VPLDDEIAVYLTKAKESLAGAERECAAGAYNNCANRAYYACFQAAVAALTLVGIGPSSNDQQWRHGAVQALFAEQWIHRRKRFPAEFKTTLEQGSLLRAKGDYDPVHVSETQARRGLRRASNLRRRGPAAGREYPMTNEEFVVTDPRIVAAIEEMQQLILRHYPGSTFRVAPGEDPGTVWMWATVDVDDADEVVALFIDRIVELQIDDGVPLHVIPVETMARNRAVIERERQNRELAAAG